MVIHALLSAGRVSALASRFQVHRNTIWNTIKRYYTTHSLEDKPRLGARPRLATRAFCRNSSLNPILDPLLCDPLGIPYNQLEDVTPKVHKARVCNFHKSRLYSIHKLWGW